jgi:hypothetical protein
MIPVRLAGKLFWDLYLYQDPPIWLAYINCVKHFDFDSLMDAYVTIAFDELGEIDHDWEKRIVFRNEERIVTQRRRKALSVEERSDKLTVFYRDNPPTDGVKPSTIGMPDKPERSFPVETSTLWYG